MIPNAKTGSSRFSTSVFVSVGLTVFLLTFLSSVLITFVLPESYESTARIKVDADNPPYVNLELLQSRVVLEPVIATLNLNQAWGKRYLKGEQLQTEESYKLLQNRLSLVPIRNTKLINVSVTSEDPREAALIANAVAENYQDYFKRATANTNLETAANLTVQIIERAEPSQVPSRPHKPANMITGAFCGLVLGACAGGLSAWLVPKFGQRRASVTPA